VQFERMIGTAATTTSKSTIVTEKKKKKGEGGRKWGRKTNRREFQIKGGAIHKKGGGEQAQQNGIT